MSAIENVSTKIYAWSGLSENQLLHEIAVALYQKGLLTFGQAAQVANMAYPEFQLLLGQNKVAIHYDVAELLEDMETIQIIRQNNGRR
jgi:predicted HTH domain antitoxin